MVTTAVYYTGHNNYTADAPTHICFVRRPCVPTWTGFLYLAVVLEGRDRRGAIGVGELARVATDARGGADFVFAQHSGGERRRGAVGVPGGDALDGGVAGHRVAQGVSVALHLLGTDLEAGEQAPGHLDQLARQPQGREAGPGPHVERRRGSCSVRRARGRR